MASVLVVAAHPDDEVLGCGGTLARHVLSGDEVRVLLLAEGAMGRRGATRNDADNLAAAAKRAGEVLGVQATILHSYPDQRLDSVSKLELTQLIETHIEKYLPAVVYTHFWGDLNSDHRIVSECTLVACRPLPGCSVKRLLFFEVPSSTEWAPAKCFEPNWFVDVEPTFDKKMKALRAYAGEVRAFPHPRSEEAVQDLARWRGATAGVRSAEAFLLARNVERSTF